MNMQKKMLFILVTLCFFLGHSESAESVDSLDANYIKSFTVRSDGQSVSARIDNKNCRILIEGIKYGSAITDVEYVVEEGFTVDGDPADWIGSWDKEETLSIQTSDGKKYTYAVILSDFERINERHYVVGYIPADYWLYPSRFQKIEWPVLTHVNVAFVYVDESGRLIDSSVKERLAEIRDKAHQYGVKVLISLRSDKDGAFYRAIKNEKSRANLVENAIQYAKDNKLDGIDIDYENYDRICPELLLFVKSLYAGKERGMLQTCAVAPWNPTAQGGYTTEWHHYFDFINVMAYDFTGGWSKEGQHSSPR